MSFSAQTGRRKPFSKGRPAFGGRRDEGSSFGDRKPWGDRGFRDNGGSRFSDRGSFGGEQRFGGEKRLYSAECSKCGNACEVPFRPTGQKPVYCRECFRGGNDMPVKAMHVAPVSDVTMYKLNEQFKALNTKLDAIIEALGIGEEEDFEEGDEVEEIEGEEEEVAPVVLDAEPKKSKKKNV